VTNKNRAAEARPASTWLERYAIPIALSVMEAQPAVLIVLLLTLVTTSTLAVQLVSTGSVVLLALGLLWWAMLLEAVLRRTQRARLVGLLYVLGWLAGFGAIGWPYFPHLLTGTSLGALFLDALLVTWFWRRGMRRAQTGFVYGQFITSFKVGFGILLGILLLVILLPQQTGLRDALADATPVYFLSGLVSISLARLGGIRQGGQSQDDSQADPTRPWLFALTAFGLVLLLLTIVIEVIFPFHSFEFVLTVLSPVWNAIGTLLGWLLYGIVFLLWPIYLLITFLVGLIRGKGNPPQQPTTGNLHKTSPKGPQGPPAIPPELYTIGRGVLIALAALVILLLIRSFLKRRMIGGLNESVEEVREGLDARSLLGQRWREWWNRRRRKGEAALELELLDPNSARARYRELLLAAQERGENLSRRPAETPAEYQARLQAQLLHSVPLAVRQDADNNVSQPTDDAILEELTDAYERERYGGRRTNEGKRTQLRVWVPQLLKRLSRHE
jgi:hypothetical protein